MPLSEEVLQQVEMWKHLSLVDEHGDAQHGVWCGKGNHCPANKYKGDDWLIASLLHTLGQLPPPSTLRMVY